MCRYVLYRTFTLLIIFMISIEERQACQRAQSRRMARAEARPLRLQTRPQAFFGLVEVVLVQWQWQRVGKRGGGGGGGGGE